MLKIDLETFDLSHLPTSEDDNFEFKSSKAFSSSDIQKKLHCAVSGFANSGGGYFIVGVNENGDADNGIPLKIGRQDIRDWTDQVISEIEPVPRYDIKLIKDPLGKGFIANDSAILVVIVYESYFGPHMSPDKHYYIRAGAHTVKAKHFIVDAIWAKRHFSKPRLTHLFRLKPGKEQIVQLGVLALTKTPAIDINITISPLPKMIKSGEGLFPIKIPVIDQQNPFFFDVTLYNAQEEQFGKDLHLSVDYYDLAGQLFKYETTLALLGSLPPLIIGNDNEEKMVKALEKIETTLSRLKVTGETVVRSNVLLPKRVKNVFSIVEGLIPEFLSDMRGDLTESPFIRECILLSEKWRYNYSPHNEVFEYYFENHPYLRNKLRILENHGLVYEITFNDVTRFIISEELAAYLLQKQESINLPEEHKSDELID